MKIAHLLKNLQEVNNDVETLRKSCDPDEKEALILMRILDQLSNATRCIVEELEIEHSARIKYYVEKENKKIDKLNQPA